MREGDDVNGDEFLAEFRRRINAYITHHESRDHPDVSSWRFSAGMISGAVDALTMAEQIITGETGRDVTSIEVSRYGPAPNAYTRLFPDEAEQA